MKHKKINKQNNEKKDKHINLLKLKIKQIIKKYN